MKATRETPEQLLKTASRAPWSCRPGLKQAAADARVVDAARAFVAAYAEVEPAIVAAFHMSQIHGMPYRGKTYGVELQALRAALEATT